MVIYNDDNAGEQVVKTHRLLITLYHYHTILVCSDDRREKNSGQVDTGVP